MPFTTEKLIKIALAALLIITLFHIPWGWFRLFRYFSLTGFSILAYYSFERKNIPHVILYLFLAVIFQPFWLLPMGPLPWHALDVAVAAGLVISVFVRRKKKKSGPAE
jgi:hypothetical protein